MSGFCSVCEGELLPNGECEDCGHKEIRKEHFGCIYDCPKAERCKPHESCLFEKPKSNVEWQGVWSKDWKR